MLQSPAALAIGWSAVSPLQQPAGVVAIDSDDIGGVVTSATGPEAGVWVIAETNDFQTRYTKIVVTDEADPNAGWKGRGLWVPEGDRTPWQKEGGKGAKPIVVHFQIRPDPLAK